MFNQCGPWCFGIPQRKCKMRHPSQSLSYIGFYPRYIVDLIVKINEMSKQNLNLLKLPAMYVTVGSLHVVPFTLSSILVLAPLRHLRPSNPWPVEKWIAPPPDGCFKCQYLKNKRLNTWALVQFWMKKVLLRWSNHKNVPKRSKKCKTRHVYSFPLIIARWKKHYIRPIQALQNG